jgi:hypothetical protein
MQEANYIYLSLSSSIDNQIISKMFSRILKDYKYELDFVDDIIVLFLSGGSKSLSILQSSLQAMGEDVNSHFKGLICPCFNDNFQKYLKFVKDDKFLYLFEISQMHKDLFSDNINMLDGIDEYTLESVKCYIEMGNSPTLAAYKLFVHRNTITYRVDKFVQDLRIDLSSFPNCVFVYGLISAKLN